jgi:hypothetical protein
MSKRVRISSVELEGDESLIVRFSDGTIAGYVVEVLLALRPARDPAERPTVGHEPSTVN